MVRSLFGIACLSCCFWYASLYLCVLTFVCLSVTIERAVKKDLNDRVDTLTEELTAERTKAEKLSTQLAERKKVYAACAGLSARLLTSLRSRQQARR